MATGWSQWLYNGHNYTFLMTIKCRSINAKYNCVRVEA